MNLRLDLSLRLRYDGAWGFFMNNKTRLLGIIALAAVIMFGMTACSGETEASQLTILNLNLTITNNTGPDVNPAGDQRFIGGIVFYWPTGGAATTTTLPERIAGNGASKANLEYYIFTVTILEIGLIHYDLAADGEAVTTRARVNFNSFEPIGENDVFTAVLNNVDGGGYTLTFERKI